MQALSPDEIQVLRQSFAERGYLVFPSIVPKEKLSALRVRLIEEFERAERSGGLFAGGGLISGHLNCFPGEESRFIHDALKAQGVYDLLGQILPKPLGPLHAGCNLNFPKSVAQHYHMDGTFSEDFTIVNTAVVDTDLVNGAIDVLPGTHERFYKYWQFAVERTHRRSTRIPMKQGDVLVRTSRLWHRGMPNHAAAPRPMVAFTFGDPGVTHHPDAFQMNDGKITFHPNWYYPTFLGRLRERTFVRAPVTYSAYRFVRSLFGSKGYAA